MTADRATCGAYAAWRHSRLWPGLTQRGSALRARGTEKISPAASAEHPVLADSRRIAHDAPSSTRDRGSVRLPGGARGLQNRRGAAPKDNTPHELGESAEHVLASCLAFLERERPDLAAIVRRWDSLPDAVRAGIVAMVQVAHDSATTR